MATKKRPKNRLISRFIIASKSSVGIIKYFCRKSSVETSDAINSVEPVPETVPEKPDDEKANKQAPNNNDKKKSKVGVYF